MTVRKSFPLLIAIATFSVHQATGQTLQRDEGIGNDVVQIGDKELSMSIVDFDLNSISKSHLLKQGNTFHDMPSSNKIIPMSQESRLLKDLPWNKLNAKLNDLARLTDDIDGSVYEKECFPEFLNDPFFGNRTNWRLINQPSGICMNHLYCAFQRCDPISVQGSKAGFSLVEHWSSHAASDTSTLPYATHFALKNIWLKSNNPSYSLPHRVLFPKTPGDISAATWFAKKYKIKISVKNSGHDYKGSSNLKDSLLINMNKFMGSTHVFECNENGASTINPDLSNQPCVLALARGKGGVVRTAGNDNFSNVYVAIQDFNKLQPDGYKFHVVGGAAGTVSPFGWTFQGGLGGSTLSRAYGFGAHQVLAIEMVLASGHHIRLGPTEWVEEEGFDYPRTISVAGVCNQNPSEENEEKWMWKSCTDDINFYDIWFAVRGGGGGTYGVITSLYLQLHPYPGKVTRNFYGYNGITQKNISSPYYPSLSATFEGFMLDFLLDSKKKFDVPEEISNYCGSYGRQGALSYIIHCFGDSAQNAFITSLGKYTKEVTPKLLKANVPPSLVYFIFNTTLPQQTLNDYASALQVPNNHPDYDPYLAGKVLDFPNPLFGSDTALGTPVILPKKWLVDEDNREDAKLLLSKSFSPYWAFGGAAGTSIDQASSLSKTYDEGGVMIYPDTYDNDFFWSKFSEIYDVDTSSDGKFPPILGHNHASINSLGPQKKNWTLPCDISLTPEQRELECISIQESIYGTKGLKRLESIKEEVDPNHLFDCPGCVGYEPSKKPRKPNKKSKKKVERSSKKRRG